MDNMDEKMEGFNRELESIKRNSKILEMQNTEQAELEVSSYKNWLIENIREVQTGKKRKEQNKTQRRSKI